MRFLPFNAPWWLLPLVPHVCGLSLLEALAQYPELSTLSSKVKAAPVLTSLLGGADGFTFFAPTNTAIEALLRGQFNTTADATLQAIVQYSLVKGAFPSVSFTNESLFIPTNLVDAKYSNVTGAQVVELVEKDGEQHVISGNRTVSKLITAVSLLVPCFNHILIQSRISYVVEAWYTSSTLRLPFQPKRRTR